MIIVSALGIASVIGVYGVYYNLDRGVSNYINEYGYHIWEFRLNTFQWCFLNQSFYFPYDYLYLLYYIFRFLFNIKKEDNKGTLKKNEAVYTSLNIIP